MTAAVNRKVRGSNRCCEAATGVPLIDAWDADRLAPSDGRPPTPTR